MPKAQALRVIDRSSARRLRAEVSYGTGLEAILCFRVLNGPAPFDGFERGPELARAQRGLPVASARASARLRTPHGDAWSCLLAMAAVEPAPHDVDSVAGRFAAMAAEDFKSSLLAALSEDRKSVV